MDKTSNSSQSDHTIREVIKAFLDERLEARINKLRQGDEKGRKQLIEEHKPKNWVSEAARRVGQIQQVTHALKFIHPDAKGTNLTSRGSPVAGDLLVGTHVIADELQPDVVGNAAALDVYKFLKLEVNGKTLLERASERDPELAQALSTDPDQANQWMDALATLTESKGVIASHKLAKQMYWPLGEERYHLLSPLFPTSLTHKVWSRIVDDRFSDTAREARRARREKRPWPHDCHDYPNLVVQKFGGTKPQNISQLNSERRGRNYLLPSFPPNWRSRAIKPPLGVDSVFGNWLRRRARMRGLIGALTDFLGRTKEVNNISIRRTRAEMVAQVCDELIQFTYDLHQLPAGWTLDERCRLNVDEQCWLDPGRAASDEVFASRLEADDWRDAVCDRFGNWLNARLTDNRIRMGEDEHREWRSVLERQFSLLRLELGHND